MKDILIVDDSQVMANLLKEYLVSEGYSVYVALDGNSAFHACMGNEFGMIITDLNLPGMSGDHLCEELRSRADTKHIPILLISGEKYDVLKQIGDEVGASDVIAKPIIREELYEKVEIHRIKKPA